MPDYKYKILNWYPVNTNFFNLLTKVKIKADVKLLELFKLAPLNNILCKISGTDMSYDNKIVYGIIDKSNENDTEYYITIEHIWDSYPDENKKGDIEFLENTVYQTIDYIEKDGDPIIGDEKNKNPEYKDVQQKDTQKNIYNPNMKIHDIFLPIAISLIIIGILSFICPKKFFN